MNYIQSLNFLLHTYQLPLTFGAVFLGLVSLLALIRSRSKQLQKIDAETFHENTNQLSKTDMEMLAGEDVITTQLDLARAYIEMGKNKLAKSLLLHVSKQGKPKQKIEARELINSL